MAESRPLAVVTGASAGIGSVYAQRLAARGFDLVLVARRGDRLEQLAGEIHRRQGVDVEPLAADLVRDDGMKAVEERIARAENLEFLVNNAGFGSKDRFSNGSVESHDAMHRLHILATMRLTHAALGKMQARGKGAIVNVSSVAGFVCRPGNTSYYATKAWMICFTEGLHVELAAARSPVRMQALCPGFTLTEFHDVIGFDRRQVPSSWWMSAEDVVDASLRGLERNQLIVVPGWRYKLLVGLLRIMPRSVMHAASGIRYRGMEPE
ncbi:MAG: SDR family NAD(P)-dependent oxidoreductase [Terriglobia bacterium]